MSGFIKSSTISCENDLILFATRNGFIIIYSLIEFKVLQKITEHNFVISKQKKVSENQLIGIKYYKSFQKQFITWGNSKAVYLWNIDLVNKSNLKKTLVGHAYDVIDIEINLNFCQLYTLDKEANLRIWNLKTLSVIQYIQAEQIGNKTQIQKIIIMKENQIGILSKDLVILKNKSIDQIKQKQVLDFRFDFNNNQIYLFCSNQIRVYDLQQFKLLRISYDSLSNQQQKIIKYDYSSYYKLIYVLDNDGNFKVIQTYSLKTIFQLNNKQFIDFQVIESSPFIKFQLKNKKFVLYLFKNLELQTFNQMDQSNWLQNTTAFCYSKDFNYLITGGNQGQLSIIHIDLQKKYSFLSYAQKKIIRINFCAENERFLYVLNTQNCLVFYKLNYLWSHQKNQNENINQLVNPIGKIDFKDSFVLNNIFFYKDQNNFSHQDQSEINNNNQSIAWLVSTKGDFKLIDLTKFFQKFQFNPHRRFAQAVLNLKTMQIFKKQFNPFLNNSKQKQEYNYKNFLNMNSRQILFLRNKQNQQKEEQYNITNIDIEQITVLSKDFNQKKSQILKIHPLTYLNCLSILYINQNLVLYRVNDFNKVIVIDLNLDKILSKNQNLMQQLIQQNFQQDLFNFKKQFELASNISQTKQKVEDLYQKFIIIKDTNTNQDYDKFKINIPLNFIKTNLQQLKYDNKQQSQNKKDLINDKYKFLDRFSKILQNIQEKNFIRRKQIDLKEIKNSNVKSKKIMQIKYI